MKIYYHQATNDYCMHSHDIMLGLYLLGHEVQSNIQNYLFLEPPKDWDLKIVSTTGNNVAMPQDCDALIDGRDQEDTILGVNVPYFKTNGKHGIKLPSCVNPEVFTSPEVPRNRDVIFLTGHMSFGREQLQDIIAGEYVEHVPQKLNPNYVASSCNIYSTEYLDVLADTRVTINAPGGGVNTKKFFESIAQGCLVLNFIPEDYHQEVSNILDIIPDELNFPKDAVINFKTKKEFDEIMADPPLYLARKTFDWSKTWTPKEKAQYVLSKI